MFLLGIYLGGLIVLLANYIISREDHTIRGAFFDLGGLGGSYSYYGSWWELENLVSFASMFLWPIVIPLLLILLLFQKEE